MTDDAIREHWLGVARTASEAAATAVRSHPEDRRRQHTGTVGEGGDRTLEIDEAAEQAILAVLQRERDGGHPCTLVSEEAGELDLGAEFPRLLVDPIDGSHNASRGTGHHAVSIAIAWGPSVADVEIGWVHDLSTGQRWWAVRGDGAWCDGRRLGDPGERRLDDGRLEMLAVEAADPALIAPALPMLTDEVRRLRCLGAIAVSLCHLAAGAVDAMATLGVCRPVDAAAGALLVLETGGFVEWEVDEPLDRVPLGIAPRTALVAGRSQEAVRALRRGVAHVRPPVA